MEKIEAKVIENYLSEFYLSFMSAEQFSKIPSTEGIELYYSVGLDYKRTPYVAIYSTVKNPDLEYNEEKGCLYFKEPKEMYPDFYVRTCWEDES